MQRALFATLVLFCSSLIAPAAAQAFGPQQVISATADGARCVHATDIDSDGKIDVISASAADSTIAWFKNLGSGSFSAAQIITTAAIDPGFVYATDLDSDGDADVVFTSYTDNTYSSNKIAWHENLGGGSFGPQQFLSTTINGIKCGVVVSDIDGDNLPDIISGSYWDNILFWFKNLGGGNFGPQQLLSSIVSTPRGLVAADLDGDGDNDVASCSYFGDKVFWNENLGSGTFGPQKLISSTIDGPCHMVAADIDGDGDIGIVTSSNNGVDKIVWHPNLGGGNIGPQEVIITIAASEPDNIFVADLDADGDIDVLSAANFGNQIAWYENLGNGIFGNQQVITTATDGASWVFATDLDADGDVDVLSASTHDDKIAWYSNLTPASTYPGSNADLGLALGINQLPKLYPDIHTAVTGNQMQLHFWSLSGSYNYTPPLLVAQAFPTGSVPVGPILFPEVHLSVLPTAPHPAVVIYDGSLLGLSPALPPAGYNLSAVIPAGMSPISIMLQGFCLAPNAGNPVFTTTDAHEIRIQ